MKNLLLLIACFLATITFGQKENSDIITLKKEHLNRKVKSIKVFYYGTTEKDTVRSRTYVYYPNGYLQNRTAILRSPLRNIKDSVCYIYNDKNLLMGQTGYSEHPDSTFRYLYSYNTYGDLTKKEIFNRTGRLNYKNVFVYNSSRNLIERQDFYVWQHADKSCPDDILKYNKKGEKYETFSLNSDCNVSSTDTNIYDAHHNLIESIARYADGIYFRRSIYKYDANDNNIRDTKYDGKGVFINMSVSVYDKKNNAVENYFYDDGDSLKPKNIFKYKREYDKKGNFITVWITKDNEAPWLKERRVIEYYK